MMDNKHSNIPQGYKYSSLGIIPKEWEVKKLGDIFSQLGSFSFSRDQMTIEQQKLNYIHYGDIHLNKEKDCVDLKKDKLPFIFDGLIKKERLVDSTFPYLKNGDIILADASEDYEGIGKSWEIIETNNHKVISGLHTIPLRSYTNEIAVGFGRYLFKNTKSAIALKQVAQGTKVYSISYNHISKLEVLVPPLPEQQKIAEILSIWNKAIEQQSKLIDALIRRKRGLMQQLLTGKKQLKGFNEKWGTVKAGTIFKNVSINGKNDEQLLSATQDNGVIPRDMLEARVTMPTGETDSFKLVEQGDFVISLRSFQGGIEYSYYRGIVSPAYTVLKPKEKINKEFYKEYFKSGNFIGHLAVAVIGIRDGKQISYNDFCFIKIPYPSIEEQTAIAKIITAADREIHIGKQKLTLLDAQKRGLMQELLTGKKRVII